MATMTISVDEDDYAAIQQAIAACQRGGVQPPEGESDLAGAWIGEICRSWLDQRGEWPHRGDEYTCPRMAAVPIKELREWLVDHADHGLVRIRRLKHPDGTILHLQCTCGAIHVGFMKQKGIEHD